MSQKILFLYLEQFLGQIQKGGTYSTADNMVIRNNIIPFKGYKLMALWPFIFARKNANIKDVDLNHEKIHFKQ